MAREPFEGRPDSTRVAQPEAVAVVAISVAAAILRFGTLDVQGFWADEAVTVGLLDPGFADLMEEIPRSESTPPLYYALAWLWTQAFGSGEVGLRSLSALCGTAAVPVAWIAARELASSRVALWVAGLAAVSPFLVWYSQEARAYALLMLLGALSVWLFARLLTAPRARDAALWALVCALALATHYFAIFLVGAQALWLLARAPRRLALAAVAPVALAGAALLPLALRQEGAGLASYIADEPLARRFLLAIKQLALGFDSPVEPLSAGLVVAIAAVGIVLTATKPEGATRLAVRAAASLAAACVLAPLALALLGTDYVLTRNLISAWLPLTVMVVAGLAGTTAGRAGLAALAVAAVLSVASTVGAVLTPAWQREDWRGAAAAIGRPAARAILVSEPAQARALRLYRPTARPVSTGRHRLTEVVALVRRGRDLGDAVPVSPDPAAVAGLSLHVVERRRRPTYELLRMATAGDPVVLSNDQLMALRLAPERGPSAVLLEPGAGVRGRPGAGPER